MIKKEAKKLLRKREVAQDIDILIISPKLKTPNKKSEILSKLRKKFSTPFDFHLVTPKEYKEWYNYFIEEKIEV
jgi:predicted nucleotidyltransferase